MIKELGGETVYPDVANFKNTEGFRLPTEVEWVWFASGGQIAINEGTFDYTYSGSNNFNEVAWFTENSGGKKDTYSNYYSGGSTQDVGLKKPNQLGLYDCSGNVFEMCYDTMEIDKNGYYKGIEKGSSYIYKAFDSSNKNRIAKGGAWSYLSKDCVIFNLQTTIADCRNLGTGFRLVRTV